MTKQANKNTAPKTEQQQDFFEQGELSLEEQAQNINDALGRVYDNARKVMDDYLGIARSLDAVKHSESFNYMRLSDFSLYQNGQRVTDQLAYWPEYIVGNCVLSIVHQLSH